MMRRHWKVLFSTVFISYVSSGCGAIHDVVMPQTPPDALERLYWTLDIDQPAIRLSRHDPYDTITVIAQPLAPGGVAWVPRTPKDSIDALQPTIWYSTDSSRVRVTRDGLIRAYNETGTGFVYVVAERTIGLVTRSARTLVQVVDMPNPPVLKSLSVRPTDSLKRAAGTTLVLRPEFRDTSNNVLTGMPVHYQVMDEKIAKGSTPWSSSLVLSVNFRPVVGTTLIRARTWIYGVAGVDTFTLEAGWPLTAIFSPRAELQLTLNGWIPYNTTTIMHLGPGATMGFGNHTGRTTAEALSAASTLGITDIRGLTMNGPNVSFIFDKPDSVEAALSPAQNSGGGNILDIPGDTLAAWNTRQRFRRFPYPGTWEYTIQPYGIRGAIVIHDR